MHLGFGTRTGLRRGGVFLLVSGVAAVVLQAPIGAADAAVTGRWVSPQDILRRAASWVDTAVPYSQEAQAPDGHGTSYRADCSGFISMAWGLRRSLTTQTLPMVATALGKVGDYTALRPGDMLDTTTRGMPVLFVRWSDSGRTTAVVMEEPHPGGVARIDSTYYTTRLLTAEGFVGYRYVRVRNPVAMDWDGDGNPDLLARRTADGALVLYRGRPGGRLAKPVVVARGLTGVTAMVELSDFDASGAAGLVVRRSDASLWVYTSAGRRQMNGPSRVSAPGTAYVSIAPAGQLDPHGLLANTSDGSVWLLSGDGVGGFAAPYRIASGWDATQTLVSAGPDGQGVSAVVVRRQDGSLWSYSGDRHGGWALPTPLPRHRPP